MSANDEGNDDLNVEEHKGAIENDLSMGILQLLKPAVEQVDRRVLDVRYVCLLISFYFPHAGFYQILLQI